MNIVSASDNSLDPKIKELSPDMIRLGMDGSQIIVRILADYQALKDAEETKRIEIETHYRERIEIYSRDLDNLVEQMRKQSESQTHYVDSMFAYANRMLDAGFPEQSVHIYELFINDSKRKNLMDYLIDYHERITLGKIKLKKISTDNNTTID